MKKQIWMLWAVLIVLGIYLIGSRPIQTEESGMPVPAIRSASAAGFTQITTNKLLLPKSGTLWYIRLISATTLEVWDVSASEVSASTTWANSKVVMSDQTQSVGGWTVTIPSGLPPDRYYVMPCDQTGGTAVYTDWDEDNPLLVIRWLGNAIIEIGSF